MNLTLVKRLNAKGGYVCRAGNSLFLTSNFNAKDQPAGYVFDLAADPAAPAVINSSLPGAWDVAVVNDHAFVCDYTKAFAIYDIGKQQWRQVAKLDMPSMTENVTIRGKLAYIANHTAGLTIVDIADPAKPAIVSNLNPKIDCDGLALWKNFAVLYGHHESRLVIVDVTDPAKPTQVGVYQHDAGTFNQGEVEVEGDFAYCTSNVGLVIVNIADPTKPKLAKVVGPKSVNDVIVQDGFAFVAAGNSGVHVLDVTDPANAVEVGRYVASRELTASQVAVQPCKKAGETGASTTSTSNTAYYYVYVANARGPALVMRFAPPAKSAAR